MDDLYGFRRLSEEALAKDHEGRKLLIRKLCGASAIGPYLTLLNSIWGFSGEETMPLHEAVVTTMTGGLFLAIELEGEPAGLVYVMPAYTKEHGYHHHSNFLGLVPGLRGGGLGFEAKRAHAVFAREDGVKLVTWTFDPLRQANADFNFRKLGVSCNTWLDDLYGSMGGKFDSGLPTDRLLVEWRLDSERVRKRLEGFRPEPADLAEQYRGFPEVIVEPRGMSIDIKVMDKPPHAFLAALPESLHELAKDKPGAARAALAELGGVMKSLFKKGYVATEYVRAGTAGERGYYVLMKKEEE